MQIQPEIRRPFDRLNAESIVENLGVRLRLDLNIWTSAYGEYERLPNNPGWAVYRGLTVRDGDEIVPSDEDYARPVVKRVLAARTEEIADLSALSHKKRKFRLAGAGMFAGGDLLRSLSNEDDVHWVPRPDNPFDEYAVEVYIRGVMVGHMAADLAEVQSSMLRGTPERVFYIGKYNGGDAQRWDDVQLSRPEPREIAKLVRALDQA